MKKVHIVCDFDDTLTTTNVARDLLRDFAPHDRLVEIRERYVSGEISFRLYQEQAFDLVGQTVARLSERAIANASIRPLARETFEAVWNAGGTVAIASAGLDIYIEPVLQKAGFDRADIYSGKVVSDPTEGPPFRYDYPSAENTCKGDWVTCKCEVIRRLKRDDGEREVIFVGDGKLSDTCAATNTADTVFATGQLLDFCVENGMEVTRFDEDFGPVLKYVTNKIPSNGDQ
ncbi:MAG: MtnX-like HAD-IB family phosphatase [Chloroflexi bacterium]|nr:MtnX-like HAD-IB family phosphatase [Chloroflexota bacterium]